MSTCENLSFQASNVTLVTISYLTELTSSYFSTILDFSASKFDVLMLPIPEEVIRCVVFAAISRRDLREVLISLQERELANVVHSRAWLRIIYPMLETLYRIVHRCPEVTVVSTYSIEQMREMELTTVDLIKYVLRTRLTDLIVREIVERVRENVENVRRHVQDLIRKILEFREQRVLLLMTSCVSCLLMREQSPARAFEHIRLCSRIVPPSHMLYIAYMRGMLEPELVRKIYVYLRTYLLEYVAMENNIARAFHKFVNDFPEYAELVKKLHFC